MPEGPASTRRRVLLFVVLPLVVAFGAIQLVPNRVKNPPVLAEPNWDSARTRELAVRACFDCHSNQTRVRWFEQIAPVAWWIKGHVDEGRAALNFSEWGARQGEDAEDAAETVRDRSMPPGYYTWLGMHSDAKLTATERRELADGLARTLRQSRPGSASSSGPGSGGDD